MAKPRINLSNPVIAIASSDEMAIVRLASIERGREKKLSSSYNAANAMRFKGVFDRMLVLPVDQTIFVDAPSLQLSCSTLYNRLTTALSYLAERQEEEFHAYRVLKICVKFTTLKPLGVSLGFRDLRAPTMYSEKELANFSTDDSNKIGLAKAEWKERFFSWLEKGSEGVLEISGVLLKDEDIALIKRTLDVVPLSAYSYRDLTLRVFIGVEERKK